jgi:NADH:ubiquinone reductase (non-electrogenic)
LTPSTRLSQLLVIVILGNCEPAQPLKEPFLVDNSEIKGSVDTSTIPYDYLVIGVGATNQTFGIKGVNEHALFLKEVWDAQKIRTRLMDCIETAGFPDQAPEEIDRLLHMIVVGGGPTGVEYAAELHDFLVEDLTTWYPGAYQQTFILISSGSLLIIVVSCFTW